MMNKTIVKVIELVERLLYSEMFAIQICEVFYFGNKLWTAATVLNE